MEAFIKYGVAVVAVIALILGIMAVNRPTSLSTTTTAPDGTQTTQTYGSVTGPDSFFPCETHNGETICSERKTFFTGSTTIASFKSPSATSSLRFAAGNITTASTTALQFEWGRATAPDATSTTLGFYNIAASTKAMVIASTTNPFVPGQATDGASIIPPNTYVNLKYGGSNCPTAGGACSAVGGYAVVEFRY